MNGKCEMCGVEGAPVARWYLSTDLGRSLCACCRIVAYNHRYDGHDWRQSFTATPETNEIARRFCVMAEDAIAAHERRDLRRGVTHAALACPAE